MGDYNKDYLCENAYYKLESTAKVNVFKAVLLT